MRAAALLLGCAASVTLSGCVAAVIPVIAAGAMGKAQRDRARKKNVAAVVAQPRLAPTLPLADKASLPTATIADVTPPPPPPTAPPAVAGSEAITAFAQFALNQAARRLAGQSVASVVLGKTVDLIHPKFLPCDPQPLAVMIDIDGDADAMRSTVHAVADDLKRLRQADVSIIWISSASEATKSTLQDRIGINDVWADTDLVMLSRGRGDRKQLQRLDAAVGRCIIAMMGDRKTDFDELFDYLRSDDQAVTLNKMWEHGWFLITSLAPPAQP